MRQIVTYVLFKMMVVLPLHADIGEITELKGNGAVLRDEPLPAFLEQDIQQMDDVRTAMGESASHLLMIAKFDLQSIVNL